MKRQAPLLAALCLSVLLLCACNGPAPAPLAATWDSAAWDAALWR